MGEMARGGSKGPPDEKVEPRDDEPGDNYKRQKYFLKHG
jgi:hypothetical protein